MCAGRCGPLVFSRDGAGEGFGGPRQLQRIPAQDTSRAARRSFRPREARLPTLLAARLGAIRSAARSTPTAATRRSPIRRLKTRRFGCQNLVGVERWLARNVPEKMRSAL